MTADKPPGKGLLARFLGRIGSLFIVAVLLFLAFGGVTLAVVSILRATQAPGAAQLRERHDAMAGWPSTTGTLFELTVIEESTGRAHGSLFRSRVKYRYAVQGKDYVGTEISMKPEAYTADDIDIFEQRMRRLVPGFSREPYVKGREAKPLESYGSCTVVYPPMAQSVRVYYDPSRPGQSILDNVEYDPASVVERYFEALFGASLGILGIALLVQGASRARRLEARGAGFTEARQAIDALADGKPDFVYAPAGMGARLGAMGFGLLLLTFAAGCARQIGWWIEMEHSRVLIVLFALLIVLPLGLGGAALLLMPYTRTVVDFASKSVTRTRWFLLLIPARRRRALSEFRCVQVRAARSDSGKSNMITVSLAGDRADDSIELFSEFQPVGESREELPAGILELARRLAERSGLECRVAGT